jgi:hypothetical protein
LRPCTFFKSVAVSRGHHRPHTTRFHLAELLMRQACFDIDVSAAELHLPTLEVRARIRNDTGVIAELVKDGIDTLMLLQGTELKVIADQLGHSSVVLTADHQDRRDDCKTAPQGRCGLLSGGRRRGLGAVPYPQLAREFGGYVIGTGRAADRQKALDFGAMVFVDLDSVVTLDDAVAALNPTERRKGKTITVRP